MTVAETLLKIENLQTHFFTDEGVVKAVNGLDLSINRGETLCLVGESGCGKSVTALSVMGLIPSPPGRIVAGRIEFDRKDLLAASSAEMRGIRGNRMAMIFQEPMTSLNPVFRVGAQIAEAIRLHQGLSSRLAQAKAVEMLDQVGIPEPKRRAREYPHQLSGGMRQRAMIAMALSCHPDLIFADEPTTALDVTIQAQILELMNKLKLETGASIVLITHDLGVVAEVGQRVAVMYAGRIVESAEVVELFDRPAHPYTQGLMDSIPRPDRPAPEDRLLKTIPGTVPSLIDLQPGCAFAGRCGRAGTECRSQNPPLTEIQPGHLVRCFSHG